MPLPAPAPARLRARRRGGLPRLLHRLLPRLGTALVALPFLHACAALPPRDPPLPPPLAAMVQAARDDASQATGIPAARWHVLRAAAVTWSDGSLGCPRPGRSYPQALMPGYLVQLQAGGTTRSYHAGEAGVPRWCPEDRARPPLPADARR